MPTEAEAPQILVDLSAHVVEQTLAPVAETSVIVKYRQSMSVSHHFCRTLQSTTGVVVRWLM